MRKKPMSIPSEDAVDTGKAGLAIGNPGVASKRNVHAALPEPVSAGASNSGAAVEISLSEVASTLAMKSDKKPMRGALFPDGEAAPQQIVGSPRAERPARSSALFEPAPMIRESATTPIAGSDQMMGIDPIQVSNPTGTAATQAKPDNTLHAPIPRAPSMERSSAMDATNLSEISEAGALARTSPKQSVSSVATKAISAVAMPGKASVPFGETPAMISKSEGDVSIQFTRPAASPGPSRAGGTLSPDEAPVASTAQVPPMFRSSRAVGRREAANISAGNQPSIDQSTAPARGGAIAGQLETSEIAGDVMSPGDTTGVSSGEIRTASTSFHMAAPPAARADHASAVMRQIVDAATTGTPNSDGSIELQLRPDELGHVRFKMMHGEHGMTMHISAERPETLDMLRRNIDQLSRYLDDLGYESTSFTFGDGQAGGNSGGDRAIPVIAQDGPQITDSPETIPPLSIASGGLDLRF